MSDPPSLHDNSSNAVGIDELIRRYKEAETAFESFFKGQVDTVLDPITALPILMRETQEHLRASEARYRRLISRNTMVIFELDADGITLFANHTVLDVFGYTIPELQGRNWWDILLPGDQHRQMGDLYIQFEHGDASQYDLTMTTKTGSICIIELNTANRRKPDGTLDRILGLGVDVTERRKVENELIEDHARLERFDAEHIAQLSKANVGLQHLADLRQRLLVIEKAARIEAERSDQTKLKFLAMVVHELRTPLTPIKGFTSTLLEAGSNLNAGTQHRFIKIIDEEVDKLANLISELVDVGRIQAGTLRVQPKLCTLTIIIDIAMAQLQSVAAQHQLVINVAPDLPVIRADVGRIAGVLVNLVGNAARYSPVGTKITLSAVQQATSVRVDVTDEGPGIAVENREKVFDAFWQADDLTSQHLKGSGLGLLICKGVIAAHEGSIWVAEVSSGTRISFTLPLGS